MELYDVMRTTFAARDYTGDPLPDAALHDILENARFAPSGGNRQGNRVIVVRDPETRDRLAELAEPAAKRYSAQVQAGESPWNTIVPTKVTPEEIAAAPAPARLTEPCRQASVVAAGLATLLAIGFGLTAVVGRAVALYVLAGVVWRGRL